MTVEQMTLTWQFEVDRLRVLLIAPTIGWLAVGFNTQPGLTGTCLIMGAMLANQRVRVEEHAILQPGDHRSKNRLGLADRVHSAAGYQNAGETQITFMLPLHASAGDDYSFDLVEGQPYHITLAYSRETDFNHHSMMRTEVAIRL
jgi:hypothetical protein